MAMTKTNFKENLIATGAFGSVHFENCQKKSVRYPNSYSITHREQIFVEKKTEKKVTKIGLAHLLLSPIMRSLNK